MGQDNSRIMPVGKRENSRNSSRLTKLQGGRGVSFVTTGRIVL